MAITDTQNHITALKVFFDGNCIVCSREIHYYQSRSDGLVLVDISHPGFDPLAYGKTLEQFMAQLHVLDSHGNWHVGIGAFQMIWAVTPGRVYQRMSAMVEWPLVRPFADLSYKLFARYRRHLPRYRRYCDGNSCRHV